MTLVANRPTQELVNLVGALRGTWHGNVAMCRCPAHADDSPSLSLRQGDRGILVTCFAGCASEDVLRELGRVRPTTNFVMPKEASHRGLANVERLWAEAEPVRGSLGEQYLFRRFIWPIEHDIRFHPRCPHGPAPLTKFKPALLIGVREGHRLAALQRIFLDPETGWYTEKATIGTLGAGAWQGGGLAPTIAIAEGFETAAAYSRLTGIPCWSPLGSRRMDLTDIPDNVRRLILAGDNDGPGRLAIRKAIKRYVSSQRIVLVDRPPPEFNDWADVLEAQERGGGGAG